ncbi:hypothetical protein QBC42DRAFT_90735 [Cladorrhinum samala]|uniref:Uncharacterized protein n=1 Tax=Cladorrhinum samala TaxID=585594 RepID=A0AAV9I334_9PEZI|nr:hypothetical protein QBC42DRAFT_90735 [Cladorrhinum samala]
MVRNGLQAKIIKPTFYIYGPPLFTLPAVSPFCKFSESPGNYTQLEQVYFERSKFGKCLVLLLISCGMGHDISGVSINQIDRLWLYQRQILAIWWTVTLLSLPNLLNNNRTTTAMTQPPPLPFFFFISHLDEICYRLSRGQFFARLTHDNVSTPTRICFLFLNFLSPIPRHFQSTLAVDVSWGRNSGKTLDDLAVSDYTGLITWFPIPGHSEFLPETQREQLAARLQELCSEFLDQTRPDESQNQEVMSRRAHLILSRPTDSISF